MRKGTIPTEIAQMNLADIWQVYALLDAPVWIVTAASGNRRGGIVATTAGQASIAFEMPRQLITVAKRHHTYPLIEQSRAFAMHLISEQQLDLVWRFGLQSGRDVDKFAGLSYRTGSAGSPLLPNAVAWLECRVEACMDSGDRAIYLTAVVNGRVERADKPLTANKLFAIAPIDKKKIMDEQYEHDSKLDAAAIQRWRDSIGLP
jgi:flavin reductase (DIM6/NTAB) family NADH-FMN oxidoreductase RutF